MSRRTLAVLLGSALTAAMLHVACDDGGGSAVKEPNPSPGDGGGQTVNDGAAPADGSTPDGDGGPTDCFANPTTHEEIINACTDAVKITKNPTLPLLYPDGGLPPLP